MDRFPLPKQVLDLLSRALDGGGPLTRSASASEAKAPAPLLPPKKTKAVQRSASAPVAAAAPAPVAIPKKRARAAKQPDAAAEEEDADADAPQKARVAFNAFEEALLQRIYEARNKPGAVGVNGRALGGVKLGSLRTQLSALRKAAHAMKQPVPMTDVAWVKDSAKVKAAVNALNIPVNSRKGQFVALHNVAWTCAQEQGGVGKQAWLDAARVYLDDAVKLREEDDAVIAQNELSEHQKENFVPEAEVRAKLWRPLDDLATTIAASTAPAALTKEQFLVLRNRALVAWMVIIDPLRNAALAHMNTQRKAPADDDAAARKFNWYIHGAAPLVILNVHKTDKTTGPYRFQVDAPFEAPFVRAMAQYLPALYAWLGKPEGSDVPLWVDAKGARLDSAKIGEVILDASEKALGKRLGSKLLRPFRAAQNPNLLANGKARGFAEQAKRSGHGVDTRLRRYANKRLPGDDSIVANFRAAITDAQLHLRDIPKADLESLLGSDTVKFFVDGLAELERRELGAE